MNDKEKQILIWLSNLHKLSKSCRRQFWMKVKQWKMFDHQSINDYQPNWTWHKKKEEKFQDSVNLNNSNDIIIPWLLHLCNFRITFVSLSFAITNETCSLQLKFAFDLWPNRFFFVLWIHCSESYLIGISKCLHSMPPMFSANQY